MFSAPSPRGATACSNSRMESLRNLSEITMDTSFVSVKRGNYAVCLHREEGTYPVRTHALQAGNQHPLGIGAGSLAMLAALQRRRGGARACGEPEGSGDAICLSTPRTQIREDVAKTRERGYALNPGRIVAGSWGLGTAVMFPDGRVAGALSIAAIDSRMSAERQPELARHMKAKWSASKASSARCSSQQSRSWNEAHDRQHPPLLPAASGANRTGS